MQRLVLPAGAWKLSGHRPMNHPQRRLGALAALAKYWNRLKPALESGDAAKVAASFRELRYDYWQHHYTLTSKAAARPMALIGEERILQMIANVLQPLRWLRDPECWNDFCELPASSENRQSLTAALRLFGPDGNQWLKREVWQQGLLQIYEDFCQHDASDCVRCLFPEQLQRW